MAERTVLRETKHYTVEKSPRGYRITAKDKNARPRSGVVNETIWNQLKPMSDREFNGSVVLELGIGYYLK